jgi:hypothetical protein
MRDSLSTTVLVLITAAALLAQSGPNDPRAKAIYQELIEINTTDAAAGSATKAADAMAGRLKAAAFPAEDVQVRRVERDHARVFRAVGASGGWSDRVR